jgi:hypothetical protein
VPDIASITSALSSIKAASDIVKLVRESGLTLEKAEVKLKLAELVEKLADAKLELASIQDLVHEKERLISELRAALDTHAKLMFEAPYYWLPTEEGRDGPYCQQCYDSAHHLIRLQGDGRGYWSCKTCKNSYTDASYRSDHIDYPNPGIA